MERHACWQQIWPEGVPRHNDVKKPFTEYFWDRVSEQPDAVALDFYGYEIRYGELNKLIDQFANALIDRGLAKGDRVGVFMDKLTAVHFILAEVCGNRLFEGIIKSIIYLTHRIVKTLLADLLRLHGVGEHDDIVEAVLKGDPEAAATAMALHGKKFGDVFLELERSEGWIWGSPSEKPTD
ncbi:GntR modulated AMP-dependent synthetase and ligase [Desulfosarcina variabilis str. Montpellier]|uniref:FCD domain-containing protein n=1 Tax=Desulfosarcina variabilis TaxID=2300 RepID=UPI003AFB2D11